MKNNYSSSFLQYFGVYPTDRTNSLNMIDWVDDKYLIDLNYKTDLDFESIINKRIEELKDYDNLILFWSGGIDSTLVFYALINNNINFEIVISKNSKLEYPSLHNKILNKEFPNIKDIFYFENYVDKYVKDKIILTGECGDQLCGSVKFFEYTIDNLKDVYTKHVPDSIIEYFDSTCQLVLQNKDATLAEYLWALNFIFKYFNSVVRFPSVLNNLDLDKNNTKLAHFFNTKDFQSWSIQNYKTNCSFDKFEDYKIEFKKYIFKSNNDLDYFTNKLKEPSLTSELIRVS